MKEAVGRRSREQGFPRSRLPEFTKEEVEFIRGTFDYFGLNHYTTWLVSNDVDRKVGRPSFLDDIGAVRHVDPKWPEASNSWLKVCTQKISKKTLIRFQRS